MQLAPHRIVGASVCLALVLFSGVALAAAALLDPAWLPDSGNAGQPVQASFAEILGRNLTAGLMLFSGTATFGVTTLLGLLGVAAFVGSTLDIAVHNAGWGGVLGSTWTYVVFEFAGVVLAGAAGIHPLVSTVLTAWDADRASPVRRYVAALTPSLQLLAASALLTLVAAAVEALVISQR